MPEFFSVLAPEQARQVLLERRYHPRWLPRIPTYTGDFLWLCQTHYQLSQPKIPERFE